MEKIRKILVNIIRNKKKLRIFLGTEFAIFIILISVLTCTIINKNKVVEVAEIDNIEIQQNETPEIIEEVENIDETEENAQELTEEEQEKAEQEENLENKNNAKKDEKQNSNSSNQAPSGYTTSYYIKVNYGANVVTIYSKDAEGNYTPIKAMVCSTGRATPKSGVYTLKNVKHRWGALFGGVWGQYTTKIVGNILFHSVPYLSASPSNLEYWEYDKLGTTASAGCVRLRVCDAKWIYDCMPAGTPVEFYSDSNPGPLGKPSAQKISGNQANRGWDPTDPDGNNPWKNTVQESQSQPIPEVTPAPAPTPTQETVKPTQNDTTGNTQANETKSETKQENENTIKPEQNNNTVNKTTENNTINNNTTINNTTNSNTVNNNTANSNTSNNTTKSEDVNNTNTNTDNSGVNDEKN